MKFGVRASHVPRCIRNLKLKRTFGFSKIDPVTQLVEYYTFNVRVMGSSPIGVTNIVNMVTLVEWFRHKFVALVYVGSNPNIQRVVSG